MNFKEITEYYQKIETASSRLEMTRILTELFQKLKTEEIRKTIYLMMGKIKPEFEGIETGMGEKLVIQAIAKTTGENKEKIEKEFLKKGDIGEIAEEMMKKRKQSSLFQTELKIEKVHKNLMKIATIEGKGTQETKLKLLAELLNSATPIEAKYIARITLESMRLGIGEPTIMDALAILYSSEYEKTKQGQKIIEELKEKKDEKKAEEKERKLKFAVREIIEEKFNIHPDLGLIAEKLKADGLTGLEKIEIQTGIPIRPTLAERLPSGEEIIKKIGTCIVEAKYDGFRVAIHKNGNEIRIFSRQSEEMTHMFPEITDAAKKQIKAEKAIVEGEALAYSEETNQFYPFQITIQRKRKYDIEKKSKELPLKLFLFDILMINGKNMMKEKFIDRRKKLEEIIEKGEIIKLSDAITATKGEEIEKYFNKVVTAGLEGIIAKDPNANYIAGARKYSWIKLKRSYRGTLQDSIDVVIIGYYKGKGKRTQFGLGALLTAIYNPDEDRFESIAKIGTGMSEEMLEKLESILNKLKTTKKPKRIVTELEPDVWVEPEIVIEVRADEITESPMHSAGKTDDDNGLALRFPRMIKIREKKAEEATTLEEIKKIKENQIIQK